MINQIKGRDPLAETLLIILGLVSVIAGVDSVCFQNVVANIATVVAGICLIGLAVIISYDRSSS